MEALDAWTRDREEAEFVASAERLQAILAGDTDVVGAVMPVEVSKRSDVDPLAAWSNPLPHASMAPLARELP